MLCNLSEITILLNLICPDTDGGNENFSDLNLFIHNLIDEIIGIFDPDIVEPFKNQPLTNEPLDFLENNFKPNAKVESLENFCFGAKNRSPRDTSEGFIRTLIGNLSDSQVGLYSMMHERAVVSHGYDHPESIRLAYM